MGKSGTQEYLKDRKERASFMFGQADSKDDSDDDSCEGKDVDAENNAGGVLTGGAGGQSEGEDFLSRKGGRQSGEGVGEGGAEAGEAEAMLRARPGDLEGPAVEMDRGDFLRLRVHLFHKVCGDGDVAEMRRLVGMGLSPNMVKEVGNILCDGGLQMTRDCVYVCNGFVSQHKEFDSMSKAVELFPDNFSISE